MAEGEPAAAVAHFFELLAVQYLGDLAQPARAWAVLSEVDEATVKLTTRDVALALPAGARLSADQQSATLVCRKAHAVDHSASFPQVVRGRGRGLGAWFFEVLRF